MAWFVGRRPIHPLASWQKTRDYRDNSSLKLGTHQKSSTTCNCQGRVCRVWIFSQVLLHFHLARVWLGCYTGLYLCKIFLHDTFLHVSLHYCTPYMISTYQLVTYLHHLSLGTYHIIRSSLEGHQVQRMLRSATSLLWRVWGSRRVVAILATVASFALSCTKKGAVKRLFLRKCIIPRICFYQQHVYSCSRWAILPCLLRWRRGISWFQIKWGAF